MKLAKRMMKPRSSGGPWTPAAISTLLWLDATDAESVIITSGTSIDQWKDKSGNGYHANPGSEKPTLVSADINGLSAINFTGNTGCVFNLDGKIPTQTNGCTAYLLYRKQVSGGSTYQRVVSSSSSSSESVYDYLAGGGIYRIPPWGNDGISAGGPAIDYANVVTPTSFTIFRIGEYKRGGTERFLGRIGEIIIAGPGLSGTEVGLKMDGYLAHKWGLTASLPANHPYKYSPPLT